MLRDESLPLLSCQAGESGDVRVRPQTVAAFGPEPDGRRPIVDLDHRW